MPPTLDLRTASGQHSPVDLGQVDLGMSDGDGPPTQMLIFNREALNLSELRVRVEGPGARAVQLARDLNGEPGTWSAGEIIALTGLLPPNNSCPFWARAVRDEDIAVGWQEFAFVVKAVVIVEN